MLKLYIYLASMLNTSWWS